jgi:hypothetical protein
MDLSTRAGLGRPDLSFLRKGSGAATCCQGGDDEAIPATRPWQKASSGAPAQLPH